MARAKISSEHSQSDDEGPAARDRRAFLKGAGMLGICGCGLASECSARPGEAASDAAQAPAAAPEPLAKHWVATLLPLLAAGDPEHARSAIRRCFEPHFRSLALEPTLDKFRGNVEGFVRHLEKEWGWVVSYSPDTGVILVDENKPYCVCPVLPKERSGDLGLLCYCSEGIAERMFSHVAGSPVHARVVASVLRGDRTCKYRIELKA
ncbi:MAG: hypothetical protein ACE148_13080 [Vicinamibacterales bacterium]